MFKVIGKDGKEYGPTTVEEIRNWIRQGRLDARSEIRAEGAAEWKPLGEMEEFIEALATAPGVGGPAPAGDPVKTSGLAVASLVLGVMGIFTLGLTALVGLVLGIVALVKIHKGQGQLRGFGAAVAGVIVSALMLLTLPVMAALMLPALAKPKAKAQTVQCLNHVKQLNLALMMYATDNKDTLPPVESWCDLIKPYLGGANQVFACPGEQNAVGKCSYALNSNVANKKLTEIGPPMQTVLIFSSAAGWNQAGGRSLARPHGHNANGLTIGYADGHAEAATAARSASLTW